MVVSRYVNCSKCDKEMSITCIDFPPYICDDCRGIKPTKDYNKISTSSREDYLKTIKDINDKRYGKL